MEDLSFDNIEFGSEETLFDDISMLTASDGDDAEGQKDQNTSK